MARPLCYLLLPLVIALAISAGCPRDEPDDDDAADDDACDDDAADDDSGDDDTVGDDDSGIDPLAPHLIEMEIRTEIAGFGECQSWVIWTVEDPDGDLDGCVIHWTLGDLYVPGTWSNPGSPGPYYELELRMYVVVGEDSKDSLDYDTEYRVDLWMEDAAGHASNHLVLEDWESPDEELCSSVAP